MSREAQDLLMMFILDWYRSQTGKISNKTTIAMMKYVDSDEGLQQLIDNMRRK